MYKLESGQIFREWTVPAPPLRPASLDWSTTRPSGCRGPRRRRGQRSLVEMAMETVAENAAGLSRKHLEPLPIQLVRSIWRFLEARGVCLHTWKTFSTLLLEKANDDDDDGLTLGLYRFRQHVCQPDGELRLYTRPLSSTAADFVTHLTISGGPPFSATELLPLAEMRNLAVLELIRPAEPWQPWQRQGEAEEGVAFPQVTDRLLRGWAEARDPFPVLGILRLWGCEAVTEVSLRWVGRLPALVLYDVVAVVGGEGACYDGWRSVREEGAASTGWQVVKGADVSVLRSLMTTLQGPSSDGGQDATEEDFCRAVDADLVSSLCCDSRRKIGFVKRGMRAPPLLKSLTDLAVTAPSERYSRTMTDTVRSGTRRCHGIPFEASNLWLYALMGQLSSGSDGGDDLASGRRQAVMAAAAGSLVLPSKPMACLFLGHSGQHGILSEAAYVDHGGRRRTRRFMFIRPGVLRREVPKTTGSEGENGRMAENVAAKEGVVRQPLMRRKKRRLEDVLGMFS